MKHLKQRWQVFDSENVQVVNFHNLKPEMRCSNLNIWNYHVLQMQHLKLPGGANAPCEAEVCFENEV